MNMIAAAKETLDLARSFNFHNQESDIKDMDYPHLAKMIIKMGTEEMSEGKLGRWLGWIQASIVNGTYGQVSLEDCKQINKRHS